MSLFKTISITCPNCDTNSDFEAAGSVNADRRPDLRDDIFENRFQMVKCPSCDHEMRLEPEFNYLDVANGQWLAAYPPRRIDDYLVIEDEVRTLFDASYGPRATPSAQDVGAGLRARLTFGWPGTREKLLLGMNGLDDVVIEMLKLDLLRRLPSAPLGLGIELRVIDVDADALTFVWIETSSEAIRQQFTANRALLTAIEEAPEDWAAVRASLTRGLFVDMQKLYIGEGRTAA